MSVGPQPHEASSLQVDGGETVSTLKAILEAETGIPAAEQLLSFTGKGLADG